MRAQSATRSMGSAVRIVILRCPKAVRHIHDDGRRRVWFVVVVGFSSVTPRHADLKRRHPDAVSAATKPQTALTLLSVAVSTTLDWLCALMLGEHGSSLVGGEVCYYLFEDPRVGA